MTNESNARDQANAQMDSIRAMVAALGLDWDRLEELREDASAVHAELQEASELTGDDAEAQLIAAREAFNTWGLENSDELAELIDAAGDCEDRDDAEQRIQEDPLSVEVRSDWHAPGDDAAPTHFNILLCTGGPAVRILGELSEHGTPTRAWLEYQDWGTPWTERTNQPGDMDTLLTYAQQFYFAE